MKSWSSVAVGVGVGALLGYLFGVQRGDPWMAGSIAVTAAIGSYGYLAYPQYRSRWSSNGSKWWHAVVGGLAPALMLLTPNSSLLADDLSTVVFVGCLWLGGVYAGVALVQSAASREAADEDTASSGLASTPE
jgi:hypothetical protein